MKRICFCSSDSSSRSSGSMYMSFKICCNILTRVSLHTKLAVSFGAAQARLSSRSTLGFSNMREEFLSLNNDLQAQVWEARAIVWRSPPVDVDRSCALVCESTSPTHSGGALITCCASAQLRSLAWTDNVTWCARGRWSWSNWRPGLRCSEYGRGRGLSLRLCDVADDAVLRVFFLFFCSWASAHLLSAPLSGGHWKYDQYYQFATSVGGDWISRMKAPHRIAN